MSRPAERIKEVVATAKASGLTADKAVLLAACADVEALLHGQMDATSEPIAIGLGASPGAASGRVYFSADSAADAYDDGDDVILVAVETSPEDVHGMEIAEGIVTTRGGLASHAAVVARGWGKPAVCGAEAIVIDGTSFSASGVTIQEGDTISINGTTGEVFVGAGDVVASEPPPELEVVLGWADEVRSGTQVRANADSDVDAAKARGFGAEGIGLCRTEHQFLGARLPLLRSFITADSPEAETEALHQLEEVQTADFEKLLQAMDGLPVTVRLLDAPLHEFCPDIESLQEANPMLGTRGVRLGILRPELFRMQTRALVAAVKTRTESGGNPILEIMVPLVVNAPEMALVRSWIEAEIATAGIGPDEILIGAMLETPRAALDAAEISHHVDFFSFGTNDLTQMTFGFSRDDTESKLMGHYLQENLLADNPFKSIDTDGVGQLVRLASQSVKEASPAVKLGVCGEHGGDPASIAFFVQEGLDYVSCSPYRVPVARLAVAQAIARAQGGAGA